MSETGACIARVDGTDSATVQRLFAQAVARWRAAGVRVVGLVEETRGVPGQICNAGTLRDVVSGRPYSIYLDVPPPDRSCHIDAKGAESAGAAVLDDIETCDVVVLSKFGKLEAGHGGLIGVFEAAISLGKPVLTTVSERHRAAWEAFAPDAAVLPPTVGALDAWWRAVRSA